MALTLLVTKAQHKIVLRMLACQEDQSKATGSPPHVRPHSHFDLHVKAESSNAAFALAFFGRRCKLGLHASGQQTLREPDHPYQVIWAISWETITT